MRNGPLPYSTRRDKEGEQEGEETFLPSLLPSLSIGDHSCATTVQHSPWPRIETKEERGRGRNGKPKWMCQYEDQARARKKGKGTGMRAGWGGKSLDGGKFQTSGLPI